MPTKETKPCPICDADVSSLRVSPKTCKPKHKKDERACLQCWEAYLSKEVEEKAPEDVQCMFCKSKLSRAELARLTAPKVATLERYDEKLYGTEGHKCQDRCQASRLDPTDPASKARFQPYNREQDGRVFACTYCTFATCTDCDRPEHVGQTCEQYRDAIATDSKHVNDEKATAALLHEYEVTPCCSTPFELEGGCGYVQCDGCKDRFCERCKAPWVGDGGHYFLGKEAHAEGCWNRDREVPSTHGYTNRFQWSEEVEAKLKAKKKGTKERTDEDREAMKFTNARVGKRKGQEEGVVMDGRGTKAGKGRAGKKQKRAASL